jgi:hypothetical protein
MVCPFFLDGEEGRGKSEMENVTAEAGFRAGEV